MDKPLNLIVLKDWKRRTRLQVMTPLVSKEAYDARRDRAGRACSLSIRIIRQNIALAMKSHPGATPTG